MAVPHVEAGGFSRTGEHFLPKIGAKRGAAGSSQVSLDLATV